MAIVIISLLMTMTLLTVDTFDQVTTSGVNTAVGTETANSVSASIESYLSGIISPLDSAFNAGNPSGSQTLTTSSPCWGAGQPGNGNSSAQTLPPTPGSPSSTPARTAITVAHDFDLVFCGLQPSTTVPHVYEISLTGCSGQYGNCTLEVTDYGTACYPGSGSPGVSSGGSSCPPTGTADVVAKFNHIWCDAFCQGTTGAGPNAAGVSVPLSCEDVPGYAGSCAGTTPPMFEYFTSIGLYGSTTTEDSRSLNYEVEHQLPSGACTNYFIDIAAGSCPGAAGELQQISLIVFRVTLLNPDGMPLPGTQLGVSGTNPAAQIADQVWVTNQVNPQYPCGPAVIEQPAPPTALFQLNDGSPSSPQVFDTVQPLDSASVDGSLSGSTFGQAPGPLACNPSLGALSLNSNVANANFVDSLYFNGQAHGNFVCSTDQHPLPPGCPANPPDSVTLEVWFDPTQNNGGNASYLMSQGPSGIELSLQNNLGGVQVTDGAASSAKVNSSLVVGKWYFFAATITAAGDTDSSSSVISAYLCGATVASGAPGCTSSVANPGTTPGGITNCDLLIGARATNSPPCSTAPPEPQPGQSVPGANCAAGYPTPPGTPGGGCPYGFFQGETADAVVYEGAALNQNQLTTEYLELSQ